MTRLGGWLLAGVLLAAAAAGGWLLARHQGQAAQAALRQAIAARDSALLVQVGRAELAGARVTPWIDSVTVLLARLRARTPHPTTGPGLGSGNPEFPISENGTPAGPVTATDTTTGAGAESPALTDTTDLVPALAEACGQLATHCAALRDSVTTLGLTVRRHVTTIDSLLAAPGPVAPALELHTGGFTTGLAVGAGVTAALTLVLVLLVGR